MHHSLWLCFLLFLTTQPHTALCTRTKFNGFYRFFGFDDGDYETNVTPEEEEMQIQFGGPAPPEQPAKCMFVIVDPQDEFASGKGIVKSSHGDLIASQLAAKAIEQLKLGCRVVITAAFYPPQDCSFLSWADLSKREVYEWFFGSQLNAVEMDYFSVKSPLAQQTGVETGLNSTLASASVDLEIQSKLPQSLAWNPTLLLRSSYIRETFDSCSPFKRCFKTNPTCTDPAKRTCHGRIDCPEGDSSGGIPVKDPNNEQRLICPEEGIRFPPNRVMAPDGGAGLSMAFAQELFRQLRLAKKPELYREVYLLVRGPGHPPFGSLLKPKSRSYRCMINLAKFPRAHFQRVFEGGGGYREGLEGFSSETDRLGVVLRRVPGHLKSFWSWFKSPWTSNPKPKTQRTASVGGVYGVDSLVWPPDFAKSRYSNMCPIWGNDGLACARWLFGVGYGSKESFSIRDTRAFVDPVEYFDKPLTTDPVPVTTKVIDSSGNRVEVTTKFSVQIAGFGLDTTIRETIKEIKPATTLHAYLSVPHWNVPERKTPPTHLSKLLIEKVPLKTIAAEILAQPQRIINTGLSLTFSGDTTWLDSLRIPPKSPISKVKSESLSTAMFFATHEMPDPKVPDKSQNDHWRLWFDVMENINSAEHWIKVGDLFSKSMVTEMETQLVTCTGHTMPNRFREMKLKDVLGDLAKVMEIHTRTSVSQGAPRPSMLTCYSDENILELKTWFSKWLKYLFPKFSDRQRRPNCYAFEINDTEFMRLAVADVLGLLAFKLEQANEKAFLETTEEIKKAMEWAQKDLDTQHKIKQEKYLKEQTKGILATTSSIQSKDPEEDPSRPSKKEMKELNAPLEEKRSQLKKMMKSSDVGAAGDSSRRESCNKDLSVPAQLEKLLNLGLDTTTVVCLKKLSPTAITTIAKSRLKQKFYITVPNTLRIRPGSVNSVVLLQRSDFLSAGADISAKILGSMTPPIDDPGAFVVSSITGQRTVLVSCGETNTIGTAAIQSGYIKKVPVTRTTKPRLVAQMDVPVVVWDETKNDVLTCTKEVNAFKCDSKTE